MILTSESTVDISTLSPPDSMVAGEALYIPQLCFYYLIYAGVYVFLTRLIEALAVLYTVRLGLRLKAIGVSLDVG